MMSDYMTTINVKPETKTRLTAYGQMPETYDKCVNRLMNENAMLTTLVEQLASDLANTRIVTSELDERELPLILEMLGDPLQSDDDAVREIAETLADKNSRHFKYRAQNGFTYDLDFKDDYKR